MIVVMIQQINVVPFSPESNRNRFLHERYGSIRYDEWGGSGESNGPFGFNTVQEVFYKMETPEAVTAYDHTPSAASVSLPGKPAIRADLRGTDAGYFKVMDFKFIDGKPFTQADFDSEIPQAVICRTVARKLFGSTDVAGLELLINHVPYRVAGVVEDVSPIATYAYAQIWVPFSTTNTKEMIWNKYMGLLSVTMLARDRGDFPKIKEEHDRLFAEFDKTTSIDGWHFLLRNRPYDQLKASILVGANNEPDVNGYRLRHLIIYAILMIVPAVNLSAMTTSRLRRRTSEIGVRRAFGATRASIIRNIIIENMIVTLIAGMLGLIASLTFSCFMAQELFTPYSLNPLSETSISSAMLLQWSTFGYALLFCLILNLLSNGIPAWKASRSNIVNALSGKH